MKKFILKIVLFFAVIALVDFCFGIAGNYLQAHAKGGETRAINDLVKNDQHDVLILGSSRAHHHYDTPFMSDTLGIDVYNAGFDGNGVILAYGLLKMITDRYEPQLVIFDVEPAFDIMVYPQDNHNTRYLKFLKPYCKENGIEEVFRSVSDEEWYKVNSGLIRYNTDLIVKFAENVMGKPSSTKGFEAMEGEMTKDRMIEENEEIDIDGLKLEYIGKLIQLAKSKNIPIAMVSSPKYGAKSSNILQPVKDLCKKKGAIFLDYYTDEDIVTHKELFKEPMHLNATGARIYTLKITKDVRKLLNGEQAGL